MNYRFAQGLSWAPSGNRMGPAKRLGNPDRFAFGDVGHNADQAVTFPSGVREVTRP
jgi:hypothetical protein